MGRHARAARRTGLEGHAVDHPRQRRRSARGRAHRAAPCRPRRSTAASRHRASATCASRQSEPNTAGQVKIADRGSPEERRREADRRRPPDVDRRSRPGPGARAALRRPGHAGHPRAQREREARPSRPAPATARSSCPFSLLVDAGTSGAAELFASAMSGNKRAELVGEHTIGRAAIQRLIKLPDSSGLWLSTARYLTPAGGAAARKGTGTHGPVDEPDVEFGQTPPPGRSDARQGHRAALAQASGLTAAPESGHLVIWLSGH